MEFNLEEFLKCREERVEAQKKLLKKYAKKGGTLLVVRANYPGALKTQYPANEIVKVITQEIKSFFIAETLFFQENISLEGLISTFCIQLPLEEVKKTAIYIEEKHPLGRFVDIDVYESTGASISRSYFGYPKRKCYLCEEDAVVCSRSMTHSTKELTNHILKSYENYLLSESQRVKISEKLGELALKSCILELSCSPSFGLVSPITSGSHKDMNYFTFLDSSFAIKKGLTEMAYLSFSYLDMDEIFKRSRLIGIETEKEMFRATNLVNTHRGMIFLLGLSIISTGKTLYEEYIKIKVLDTTKDKLNISNFEFSQFSISDDTLQKISNNIKTCCRNLLDDFNIIPEKIFLKEPLTNGERLYFDHGFLGIRGEVANGLTIIFNKALPFLEIAFSQYQYKGEPFNLALVKTLLLLMSEVDDSTIVNRGGLVTLKKVKSDAKKLLELNVPETLALELEKEYIKLNISPGGSADLLATTIFFYFLREDLTKKK